MGPGTTEEAKAPGFVLGRAEGVVSNGTRRGARSGAIVVPKGTGRAVGVLVGLKPTIRGVEIDCGTLAIEVGLLNAVEDFFLEDVRETGVHFKHGPDPNVISQLHFPCFVDVGIIANALEVFIKGAGESHTVFARKVCSNEANETAIGRHPVGKGDA